MTVRSLPPVPEPVLIDLFNFVAGQLGHPDERRCDHTLRFTCEFIRTHALDECAIILWLESHGGFCDCEVMFNVACTWNDDGPYVEDDLDPDPHHLDSVLRKLEGLADA